MHTTTVLIAWLQVQDQILNDPTSPDDVKSQAAFAAEKNLDELQRRADHGDDDALAFLQLTEEKGE